MAKKKLANPFYVLVVLAGIAFTVTACAYGVLVVRSLHPPRPTDPAPTGLLKFLDQHGTKLLLSELAILGAASFLAMGTDRYWSSDPGAKSN